MIQGIKKYLNTNVRNFHSVGPSKLQEKTIIEIIATTITFYVCLN